MARTTTRTSTMLAIGAVVAALAVGVGVASALGGGGSDNANGSIQVDDLGQLEGSWKAINWTGAPAAVVGEVRLRFEGDRLLVETGCNAGRGTVEVDDSHLVAGPLMSTKMGCEAPLMEQETWLFDMVAASPRLELSGPYLYLHWDPSGTSGGDGGRHWLGLEQETAAS